MLFIGFVSVNNLFQEPNHIYHLITQVSINLKLNKYSVRPCRSHVQNVMPMQIMYFKHLLQ